MKELTLILDPGLTLTARLLQADVVRVSGIVMTESAIAGLYTGSVPPGTQAGAYQVLVNEGATIMAAGELNWDGVAEIAPGAGGAGTDPLLAEVPGNYAAGTAGAALGKLNIGAPSAPVGVVPLQPGDAQICRVYGFFESLRNKPGQVQVSFKLTGPLGLHSDRILVGREVRFSTDATGALSDGTNPWIELQRNDMLQPAGSQYEINAPALGVRNKIVTLTTPTAEFSALVAG